MATIYEISEATGVPLKTLRRVQAKGFLKVSKETTAEDSIRKSVAKQHPLTVVQLLHLIKNPDLCERLNLEEEIASLGYVEQEAAPWVPVGVRVSLAASKNPDAIASVAEYVRERLDGLREGVEVPYAWLGVRLLYNVPSEVLKETSSKLRNAMWNVRTHPILAGYSRPDEKNKIRYFRKITLDL